MKIFFIFIFSAIAFQLSAQNLFSYDFSQDTVGKALNGRNGWSNSSADGFPGIGACAGAGACDAKIIAENINRPGFAYSTKALDLTKGDGVGHFLTNDNALPKPNFAISYTAGEQVYAAFAIRLTNAIPDSSLSGGQVIRLYGIDQFNSNIVGMRLLAQKKNDKIRFGIEKNGGTGFTGFDYDFNQTHLIVMRYTYRNAVANDDSVALFINPVRGAEPAPIAKAGTGSDASLNRLVVYLNNPSLPNAIRIGSLGAIKVTKNWTNLINSLPELKNEVLRIQPSLVSNTLTVKLDKPTPSVSVLKIVDMNGREVQTSQIMRGESFKDIDTQFLPKGIYLLTIQNEQFIATQKFVKI
jgi:hypothetical protein